MNAAQYDFCEKPPASISGRVMPTATRIATSTIRNPARRRHHRAARRAGQRRRHDDHQRQRRIPLRRPARTATIRSTRSSRPGTTTAANASARPAAQLRRHRHDSRHPASMPACDATQYDFCEKVGVMLSGNVYHDRSNDGIFDRADRKKASRGVVVKLLDANGNDTGLRATTDAARLLQVQQPGGRQVRGDGSPSRRLARRHRHAGQPGRRGRRLAAGRHDQPDHDQLGRDGHRVQLRRAAAGLDPRPRRHVDRSGLRSERSAKPPIAGVRIDLLDASGNVIATTLTDANGEYEFTGLRPGTYSVREHQPSQLLRRRRPRRQRRRHAALDSNLHQRHRRRLRTSTWRTTTSARSRRPS